MKRIATILIVLAVLTVPVFADHDTHDICMLETGEEFGQHVAEYAQERHFDGEMNPGVHQGYSICVPSADDNAN